MFHARLFAETSKYRDSHFEPLKTPLPSPPTPFGDINATPGDDQWRLDGNPKIDRPLFVQFCTNNPDEYLAAAKHVQSYCDAVDLNLGCPQGIAKRGHYGAFLQEDRELIYNLVNKLHQELDIPVTVKMRVLETKEATLAYAKLLLDAGASIISVHGRLREQKGHKTGLADWKMIRYLRDSLPPDTVLFANGNILQHEDVQNCLDATGADAVMSAEGNLYDPSIFGKPPPIGQEGREYWRGKDGKGGYRMDAVLRRYMDIIHKYVLGKEPPIRKPLFILSDLLDENVILDTENSPPINSDAAALDEGEIYVRSSKRQKKHHDQSTSTVEIQSTTPQLDVPQQEAKLSPNLTAIQAHLFHLLRTLVSKHTHIRDVLARTRAGEISKYERLLSMVEDVVRQGIIDEDALFKNGQEQVNLGVDDVEQEEEKDPSVSSKAAIARCKRPWFICQSYIRPLPHEALEKGSLQLSKKMRLEMEKEKERIEEDKKKRERKDVDVDGHVEVFDVEKGKSMMENTRDGELNGAKRTNGEDKIHGEEKVEIPKDGLVCG